ncbi:MAG: pitrilysin family protein [Candidatus Omnitrophota bacterium]
MIQQYKNTILDNGLKIIAHDMPDRLSLALGIWIKAGGRYESDKVKGISHFLEHLLFKGTKKYSCRKLKESIEGLGGALNGFTSEELTCYLVKIPASHWELASDVLSDMVINPSLPGSEVEKEKAVILEEIKMYRDQPASYVYELLDELLWPGQPLGAPIIGTAGSVTKLTRQDLSSFKQEYYTPGNIVISAAGRLDFDKLVKKTAKCFSGQRKQGINTFSKVKEEQAVPQLKVFHKDTEQTHMALGFHAFKRGHPLRHALGILHVILGANMSSRLFEELREKRGMAYEIGTMVKRYQDTGAFIVHAGIDNRKAPEAIKLILKELQKCKYEPVTTDAFKRAKEFYIGQLMLALEDTLDHMLWIGETTAALDKAYSLEDIIKEVNRIKREDVKEVAKRVFKKENLNLALIGPLENSEEQVCRQLVME